MGLPSCERRNYLKLVDDLVCTAGKRAKVNLAGPEEGAVRRELEQRGALGEQVGEVVGHRAGGLVRQSCVCR